MKKPDKIEINKKQSDDIIARLDANALTDFDRTILKLVLQWYLWLQSALLESKISISRIKSMFGFQKTESSKNLVAEIEKASLDDTDEDILALLSVEAKDGAEQDIGAFHQNSDPELIDAPSNQNSQDKFGDNSKKKATAS